MEEIKADKYFSRSTVKKIEEFITLDTGEKGERQLYKLKKTFEEENVEYALLEKQIKVTFKEKAEKRFIDHRFSFLAPEERNEETEYGEYPRRASLQSYGLSIKPFLRR